MSIVELEKAVESLSAQDFREFMDWLDRYHEELWDQQIEADVKSGRLDDLAAAARQESRDKKTRPLPGCLT